MVQSVNTWAGVAPKLLARPKWSPQRFHDGPFVIREEDVWFAPPANLGGRYYLEESFERAPAAARTMVTFTASVALAEMQAFIQKNRDFEHVGTNNSDDDVTVLATGGIRLETDGGGADIVAIQPITGSTGCTNPTKWIGAGIGAALGTPNWSTDNEIQWGCVVKTTTTISATTLWAGLKLTATNVIATDDDQAFFRAQAGVWDIVTSVGGTDVTAGSGISLAASTQYDLRISVDSDRIPSYYINNKLVGVGAALTTAVNLFPVIGVYAGAAAAKSLQIHKQWISQTI